MTDLPLPLVSVVVPVYRHQPYLEPALQSILALDYNPLQIIIQDDASPDDAFDVIEQIVGEYQGPHDVKIGKNEKNLSMGNFNVLMDKASADYIVAAHDDDIQNPERISKVMDAFLRQDVSMVTSNAIRMTADGDPIGADSEGVENRLIDAEEFARTGWTPFVYGAALSWHRDVFEKFGPIDIDGTARASDWIIPYRASLLNGIYYLKNPMLLRRMHKDSRGSIGRNTDDHDIFKVENYSESVTQLIYMLKTTDFALDKKIVSKKKHQTLSNSIRDLIIDKCSGIAVSRNRLHMRKLRVSWISHDAGAVTQDDLPNLGSKDDFKTLAQTIGTSTASDVFSNRRKIVKKLKGTPWYQVAIRHPWRVKYWWTLRRLQRQFQKNQ
ncbi:MAG: glycosyltransferase [Pseudomonadota bacterium]